MSNNGEKLVITNGSTTLNTSTFFYNDSDMSYDVPHSKEYISSRLPFPCEQHSKPCKRPHIELYKQWDNKILALKICDKHRHVVPATIVIDSLGNVKVYRLELCVERVVSDRFRTKKNFKPTEPDTP